MFPSSFRRFSACFGPHCKHTTAAKMLLSNRISTRGLGLISTSEVSRCGLDFKMGQSSPKHQIVLPDFLLKLEKTTVLLVWG